MNVIIVKYINNSNFIRKLASFHRLLTQDTTE
jgi:hypothetical protein